MKPSKYQLAIYDAVKSNDLQYKNICVQATAGAGKTTTLLEILNLIPKFKKTIFLSFSNTIVNELKSRVPVHAEASTLHSLGCKMIFRHHRGVKIDNDKWFKIILNTYEERDKKTFKKCFEIADIINYARMTLTKFDEESLAAMCDYYGLNCTKEHLTKAIEEFDRPRKLTKMDFTDMIYLPVKMKLIDIEYDYVLLDEAQDLNKSQRLFIERILKPSGRLIAVGDANQSIYSFSGASIDSFTQLQSRENTTTLPLSISYRCAKSIVEKAQSVYPDAIQFSDFAKDGEVREGSLQEVREGDLIICRKTAPLVSAFFKLLERGVKAHVIGKDVETGLVNLAERIQAPTTERTIAKLTDEFNAVIEELKEKGIKNFTSHPQYVALEEKAEVLKVVLNKISNSNELSSKIKEIFREDKKGVKLMTIHRSKGLEADKVFIIERYEGERLCPSKRATQNWEKIQENNLLFVAYTRAKSTMILLSLDESKSNYENS